MKTVSFPYCKAHLEYTFDEVQEVLTSSIEEYVPEFDGVALVEKALQNPIGYAPLRELAKGKDKVVIISNPRITAIPDGVSVMTEVTK